MKNFIKGRWFPLTVAAVFGLIVGSILFSCGFRITYDRELESSWAAISAVAAWAGAVGTVAAVFSAIYVAYRQNIISLFEKRYKVYTIVRNYIIFAVKLEKISRREEAYPLFLAAFDKENILNKLHSTPLQYLTSDSLYENMATQKYQEVLITLDEARFLFGKDPDIIKYTQGISESLLLLLAPSSVSNNPSFEDAKNTIVSSIKSPLFSGMLAKMEKILEL